jgi:hypothetical protein
MVVFIDEVSVVCGLEHVEFEAPVPAKRIKASLKKRIDVCAVVGKRSSGTSESWVNNSAALLL